MRLFFILLIGFIYPVSGLHANEEKASSTQALFLGWRAYLDDLCSLNAWKSQIYETNTGGGTVGKYDSSGKMIKRILIQGLSGPNGIAVSGPYLYITNQGNGTVAKYTTSGTSVDKQLIGELDNPIGVAVSGSDLYVVSDFAGVIGKYTTAGKPVNPALITGLDHPVDVAVSGRYLLVTCASGVIGEYTTSGAVVNRDLVGKLTAPWGIVTSGSNFYVTTCMENGVIAEFTLAGQLVNGSLVRELDGPVALAISGHALFVSNEYTGVIGEYSTSGATINKTVASGFRKMTPWGPYGLAVASPRISITETTLVALFVGGLIMACLLRPRWFYERH